MPLMYSFSSPMGNSNYQPAALRRSRFQQVALESSPGNRAHRRHIQRDENPLDIGKMYQFQVPDDTLPRQSEVAPRRQPRVRATAYQKQFPEKLEYGKIL